jgi:hypothetical protein
MTITIGQRLTLLTIDDCLAMTHRYELEALTVLEPQAVGYQSRKRRVATVRQRGKRKAFYLDLSADDILLDGWDVPFKTDGEAGGVFSGNACFNLVGSVGTIREYLETRAVLPVSDQAKAKVLVADSPRSTCDDRGLVLAFPEIETHHAVVNRFKQSAE